MKNIPHTVLIAEDEMLLRLMAADLLSVAGFTVFEAEHADDASRLLAIHRSSIHVLFTDIHMPGSMDGVALAHHARRVVPSIAVLLVSGDTKPHEEALPAGSRFLSKPYDPDHLVASIKGLLGS